MKEKRRRVEGAICKCNKKCKNFVTMIFVTFRIIYTYFMKIISIYGLGGWGCGGGRSNAM